MTTWAPGAEKLKHPALTMPVWSSGTPPDHHRALYNGSPAKMRQEIKSQPRSTARPAVTLAKPDASTANLTMVTRLGPGHRNPTTRARQLGIKLRSQPGNVSHPSAHLIHQAEAVVRLRPQFSNLAAKHDAGTAMWLKPYNAKRAVFTTPNKSVTSNCLLKDGLRFFHQVHCPPFRGKGSHDSSPATAAAFVNGCMILRIHRAEPGDLNQ